MILVSLYQDQLDLSEEVEISENEIKEDDIEVKVDIDEMQLFYFQHFFSEMKYFVTRDNFVFL